MKNRAVTGLLLVCMLMTALFFGGCGKSGSSGGFNVIVMGHIGHGKSELTSAIASAYGKKVSVDQLNSAKECKSDGVVYHAECVSIKSDSRNYNIYDLPDYKDIGKSIASKGIVPDGVILVVNFNDSIMPQTAEHIKLIKSLGIKNVVVYITNCSDSELAGLLIEDINAWDFEKTDIITDYDNFSAENAKKTVSVMDKWTAENNAAKEVSGTSVNVYSYALSKDEGGSNTPVMSSDELEITINNKTYKGTLVFPGVDMMMPGDFGQIAFDLDASVSAKAGDKVTVKKDGKDVIVGVVVG